ncbi:hypothetical protein D9611_006047 [Ephemerocybe angulata]|uniref:Uncharacterized protein n=1 Tax=Ephemerocybe angulata TaxID=980116 RepID=A0A8H5FL26_9AGAR|nr:hypothetical protein D9611_006047 [Tulosesus angulatus]
MPPGRLRLYTTPEEKKAANRSKSNRSYQRYKEVINKAKRVGRRKAARLKQKYEPEEAPKKPLPAQKPARTDLEVLSDRIPQLEKRLDTAMDNKNLSEYLKSLCEKFAARQKDDLEGAGVIFDEEEEKLCKISTAVHKYQSLATNLDCYGGSWRLWEPLRRRVAEALNEVLELSGEAILGPGQLVVDLRRGSLRFQRRA